MHVPPSKPPPPAPLHIYHALYLPPSPPPHPNPPLTPWPHPLQKDMAALHAGRMQARQIANILWALGKCHRLLGARKRDSEARGVANALLAELERGGGRKLFQVGGGGGGMVWRAPDRGGGGGGGALGRGPCPVGFGVCALGGEGGRTCRPRPAPPAAARSLHPPPSPPPAPGARAPAPPTRRRYCTAWRA
jgi:hypothetical protein